LVILPVAFLLYDLKTPKEIPIDYALWRQF